MKSNLWAIRVHLRRVFRTRRADSHERTNLNAVAAFALALLFCLPSGAAANCTEVTDLIDFESLSEVLGIDGAEPFDPVDFTACDGVLSHLLLESVAASSAETLLQQTGPFRPAVEGLLEAVAPGAGDLVEGMAALAV